MLLGVVPGPLGAKKQVQDLSACKAPSFLSCHVAWRMMGPCVGRADPRAQFKPVLCPPSDGAVLSESQLMARGLPPKLTSISSQSWFPYGGEKIIKPARSKGCGKEPTEIVLARHTEDSKWQPQGVIFVLL